MRKVHAEEHIIKLFLYSISMFLWRNSEMTARVVSVKKMLLQIIPNHFVPIVPLCEQ